MNIRERWYGQGTPTGNVDYFMVIIGIVRALVRFKGECFLYSARLWDDVPPFIVAIIM